MSSSKPQGRNIILLFALAVAVRGGLLLVLQERLGEDVDAYLTIARNIADGNGFSIPGSEKPTAYRPPLYPLLLASVEAQRMGVILLHLAVGVGTVLLVWRLGRRLVSDSAALWCAALVSFDPLLLQYSTQPMTETLCAFLAALALNLMIPWPQSRIKQSGLGLVLGLCILSRPTFLAFAGVSLLVGSYQFWRKAKPISGVGFVLLGLAIGVLPWGIRNAFAFGEFCITTTHGGYTLLLANNPVFYEEVVSGKWGAVWTGESLARWQSDLEMEMRKSAPEPRTEFERDRWMTRRALSHIAENPAGFLKASAHRFCWFWNIFPPESARIGVESLWRRICNRVGLGRLESSAEWVARFVSGGVTLFYMILFVSFAMGLVRLSREEWPDWWPVALVIASFCAVHLIYWTDARMRAPVMPAVALFVVRAWFRPVIPSIDQT